MGQNYLRTLANLCDPTLKKLEEKVFIGDAKIEAIFTQDFSNAYLEYRHEQNPCLRAGHCHVFILLLVEFIYCFSF